MVDDSADQIREMIGEIEIRDCYRTKSVKVKKLKEKIKLIMDKTSFDPLKSQFKENITVLAAGNDLLIEAIVPDTDAMSKYLTIEFKDGKYESTIDRKRAIRQTIFDSIFGSRAYYDIDGVIDSIYDIDTKAEFVKGQVRLRHKAIKEINAEDPFFLKKDDRIRVDDFKIHIQPIQDLVEDVDCNSRINSIVDKKTLPVELGAQVKGFVSECQMKIEHTDYRAYRNQIEIKSVLKESIKREINSALEEAIQFENDLRPKLQKMKDRNTVHVDELESKVFELLATWDEKNLMGIYVNVQESIIVKTREDVIRSIKWKFGKTFDSDRVWVTYNNKITIEETKEELVERNTSREPSKVGMDVMSVDLPFYLTRETDRHMGTYDMMFFIERIKINGKTKFIIYNAKGIWARMETSDYQKMKPYFDEQMELIKEVEI